MATLTASSCQTSSGGFFLSPPRYIENGVVARSAIYNFTVAQSAGDVVQMIPIPKGALILDVQLLPSLGGVTFAANVGDGNSGTRFIVSATANAVVARNTTGLGYSYSADDTIDVTMVTIGSGSAAGSIRLSVMYSFDNAPDGNS